MSESKNWGYATQTLHAGQAPDGETGARAVPIYQTTSYLFDSTEHAANLFALKEFGNIYTRLMNPTTDVLEKRLAALDGGVGALVTSSGMAAITMAVLNITQAGQNIVSSAALYGGTRTLFQYTLRKLGIEVRFVDPVDPASFAEAIDENTRMLFAESIGNPNNRIPDFEAVAAIAHSHNIPFVIDNTVSPMIFRPFDHGADIAVYSLTKFLGGHGTSIGGAVVDSGRFDWSRGNFPEIMEPDPSYHNALNYWEAFGLHDSALIRGAAYIMKARLQILRDMGSCASPLNSFLFLQGIETIALRMERQCANALAVARWLESRPEVAWVNYPGLSSHRDFARAQKYMNGGCGAIIGFGIVGGIEAGKKMIDSVKLLSHLANIGDAKTLVIHPASTTHQQLSPEEQKAAGVGPDFIRLSVGLEDPADIMADLDQALKASQKA